MNVVILNYNLFFSERKLVIALPDKAFSTDWDGYDQAKPFLEKINDNVRVKTYNPILFK